MKANLITHNVPEAQIQPDLLSAQPGTTGNALASWRAAFDDATFSTGAILLLFSGGVFVAHDVISKTIAAREQDGLIWFGIHYVTAVIYGIIVLSMGGFAYLFRNDRRQQAAIWLSLLLWYLSAFALNRQLAVFEQSVPWLRWIIVGSGALMVLHAWADKLPHWGQQVLYAGLTGACLLFVYQAAYVGSLYAVSIPGLLMLGISFHTFIPALLAFVVGRQLWVGTRQRTYLRPAVLTGLMLPVTLLIIFLFNWQRTVNRLEQTRVEAALRQTSDLPDWVQLAQQLKPGPLTDRILKVNLVYGTSPWSRDFGNLTAMSDVRLHDPLVVIAQNLFPVPAFSDEEQSKLLRTVSQQHYGTESKLWNGRNLTTSQVATQVRIWPQYRLSYTEKTLWVQSAARFGSQEALYTFHLPEGSAVSALSLWINGREEPGRLTTQAKADSAYKQIVGVESMVTERDPSVVTWQEGNRVTVRVFPVLAGKDRQVKIGITSPLRFDGKMLAYQNPWFEGPDASGADETLKLTVADATTELKMNGLSGPMTNRELIRYAAYQPDWSVEMVAPALSPAPFRLAGKAYQMAGYVPAQTLFQPADLYLDVNEAWTETEFEGICELTTKQPAVRVWVFRDGLTRVTPANRQQLFAALAQQPFSLFPIYRIAQPETALLITKGVPSNQGGGPTLSDLKGSVLADRLTKKATDLTSPIRTYNLGNDLPPYLKTLTELRILHAVTGDLTRLQDVLTKHQFETYQTTDNQVVLPGTGIVINQLTNESTGRAENSSGQPVSQQASLAPDHLLRLFTYNQLMQSVGRQYFNKAYRNSEALAALAQMGHVVSPVSSLVVLETQEDYDRFDIKADRTGLDNATLKQDGAVPEPHEWAMLLLIALLVSWFYIRPRFTA